VDVPHVLLEHVEPPRLVLFLQAWARHHVVAVR
jgi:hypothetical protein